MARGHLEFLVYNPFMAGQSGSELKFSKTRDLNKSGIDNQLVDEKQSAIRSANPV